MMGQQLTNIRCEYSWLTERLGCLRDCGVSPKEETQWVSIIQLISSRRNHYGGLNKSLNRPQQSVYTKTKTKTLI